MKKEWIVLDKENRPVTTSWKVSELFGEQHENILAKIEMLDFSSEFFRRNFNKVKYFNKDWKLKSVYEMTREGFIFISIGFTGQKAAAFSDAFINAFDEMGDTLVDHTSYPSPVKRSYQLAVNTENRNHKPSRFKVKMRNLELQHAVSNP